MGGGARGKWLVYSLTPATAVVFLPPPPPPPPPFRRNEGGSSGSGGSVVRRGEILACLEWLEAVGVVNVVAVVNKAFSDLVKSLMFLGFNALSSASTYCMNTTAPFATDFVFLKADLVDC